MAINSSILAWTIPWIEEPGGLHGGHKESDPTEQLTPSLLRWLDFMFVILFYFGDYVKVLRSNIISISIYDPLLLISH